MDLQGGSVATRENHSEFSRWIVPSSPPIWWLHQFLSATVKPLRKVPGFLTACEHGTTICIQRVSRFTVKNPVWSFFFLKILPDIIRRRELKPCGNLNFRRTDKCAKISYFLISIIERRMELFQCKIRIFSTWSFWNCWISEEVKIGKVNTEREIHRKQVSRWIWDSSLPCHRRPILLRRKYSWMIVPILRQPTRHNGGSREPLDFPISSTNERRRETREATMGRHRVHRQWPLWQPPSTGSRS